MTSSYSFDCFADRKSIYNCVKKGLSKKGMKVATKKYFKKYKKSTNKATMACKYANPKFPT